jgi:hypothetical protein
LSLLIPFIVVGALYNVYESIQKKVVPYIIIFVAFYLTVISNIPHKEDRFQLPIMPYLFLFGNLHILDLWLLAGSILAKGVKRYGYIVSLIVCIISVYEIHRFV